MEEERREKEAVFLYFWIWVVPATRGKESRAERHLKSACLVRCLGMFVVVLGTYSAQCFQRIKDKRASAGLGWEALSSCWKLCAAKCEQTKLHAVCWKLEAQNLGG